VNQCDGCGRGLPVSGGLHRGEGYDLMACTADRYAGAQPKRDDQMKGILMSEISPEGEALPPSEREAFEREFKYISHEGSFSEWSERWTYRHSHVDALWCGWMARAVLAAPQNTQDHLAVPQEYAPAFSWHCTSEDDYPTGQVSTSPLGNGDVALTFGDDAKANARFIANAPRVYAALQALVTGLAANDEEGLIEHAEVMQEARAALAAAPKE
jgi:hypothetical protein